MNNTYLLKRKQQTLTDKLARLEREHKDTKERYQSILKGLDDSYRIKIRKTKYELELIAEVLKARESNSPLEES